MVYEYIQLPDAGWVAIIMHMTFHSASLLVYTLQDQREACTPVRMTTGTSKLDLPEVLFVFTSYCAYMRYSAVVFP